jgi:hypothetical protein
VRGSQDDLRRALIVDLREEGMDVRRYALVLCVAFVVGIAATALAQPFADTPTNHWAYEALAQLAAKGLIQGYPDGTFKGDRTTRYEMAMVVARLLARIESIKLSPPPNPPPQPEVTKEDIDLGALEESMLTPAGRAAPQKEICDPDPIMGVESHWRGDALAPQVRMRSSARTQSEVRVCGPTDVDRSQPWPRPSWQSCVH